MTDETIIETRGLTYSYANKLVAWSNVGEDARITMPLE